MGNFDLDLDDDKTWIILIWTFSQDFDRKSVPWRRKTSTCCLKHDDAAFMLSFAVCGC